MAKLDKGEYVSTMKRVTTRWYFSSSVTSIAWVPLVKRITWDQQHVEVEWENGTVKKFRWNELKSVKETDLAYNTSGVVVHTTDGETFGVPESGSNYDNVIAVLKMHIS